MKNFDYIKQNEEDIKQDRFCLRRGWVERTFCEGKMYFASMKLLVVLLALFPLCAFYGCSDSGSSDSSASDFLQTLDLKDFSLVKSKGKSVFLGTRDSNAAIDERPMMESHFDYDFWLGKHEVTCKEMGLDCADSLPATNVALYDAVLYSNRRSVAEGFDTVYSYTSAKFDNSGSCVAMEGLVFHPEVNGYRLPTEAEWMYVAGTDWNPENGWNSQNSNYELHTVCSAKVGREGFCDFAGNAAEWVNDLKVRFRSENVSNFVGGKAENGLDERVLKGGSFRNGPSSIRLYSRSDVYAVTSSTKADYVGFRLAFGAIPNPTYLNSDGIENVVGYTLLANSKTVNDFVGAKRSKLIFRDDATEHLVYVNFDGAVRFVDEVHAEGGYHPDISPDGRFVAFSTGQEGISGLSKVSVRQLESTGIETLLPVESAAIPRWRVLENGDTVIVYVTDAGNNKNDDDFMKRGTYQVRFSSENANGKFGEPEKLFDGAYHGGVSKNNKLAVSGSTLLRARVNGKNEVWYGGNQACNVSLSRGGANRTLFLDFGGKAGRDFVGESYGVHERVLIADSTGKLKNTVASPEGYSFDHTEWISNSDSIFIATLVDANGAHRKIVLVNVNTGDVLPVVEGEELWHPVLWTGMETLYQGSWDYDSLGVYNAEHGQFSHVLPQKMSIFWKYRDSAEVVCLGNSRMQVGVDPDRISRFTINLSTIPCDLHAIDFLYESYVSLHVKNLKYLVVGLDFDLWNEFEDMGCINANRGDALGFLYDDSHNFWPNGVDSLFVKRVEEIANVEKDKDYINMRKHRGWVPGTCGKDWGSDGTGYVEIMEDSTWSDDDTRYESNFAELERILDLAKKRNVVVVGVIFPTSPYYRNTGSFGRHGMRRSAAENLVRRIEKIAKENENFVLMDENKMGNHDYSGKESSDYDHLCMRGAAKLTSRLDSLLKSLDSK